MPNQVEKLPCEAIIEGANISFTPMNDKANDAFAAFFAAEGTNTTVAITAPDASRDGYDSANQPYSMLLFTTS